MKSTITSEDLSPKYYYKILYQRKLSERIMLRLTVGFQIGYDPVYAVKHKSNPVFTSLSLEEAITCFNSYELF